MAHGSPILLDGTHGEGGGALLRTALAMAAVTQQPMRITGIRGGTKFPGLNAEDLVLIRALAESCGAETTHASSGSHELSFLPTRRPRSLSGTYGGSSGDAFGSPNAVVLGSSLIPVMARTGSYTVLTCEGETYGHAVLSFDYFHQVALGAYRRLGLYATADLIEAGYGRGSKGEIRFEVEPSALGGLEWAERGKLVAMRGTVVTSELDGRIADRGVTHLERLVQSARLDMAVDHWSPSSRTAGCHVTLMAEFENGFGGSTAMGARGIRIESVVQQALDHFLQWLAGGATVDTHLADQLLVPLAISESDSILEVDRLTPRLLTSVWVIKQFLPIRLTVKGQEGGPGTLTIRR